MVGHLTEASPTNAKVRLGELSVVEDVKDLTGKFQLDEFRQVKSLFYCCVEDNSSL